MVSGFLTSPFDQTRIWSAVARPMRSWSKLLTSTELLYLEAICTAAFVLFVTAPFGPADVDAELLGDAEDVLVELSHLDLLPGGRQHLDVEAQRLHLLDQQLEGLGNSGLGDVLALDDGLVDLHAAKV